MTVSAPAELAVRQPSTAVVKRRWSRPQYLALIGIPILFLNVWTVIAWLADGPRQVTQFRDRHSASWYAAHTYEGLYIVASIVVLVYVIRGCRRERRVLTFDVMFLLCGA